MFPKSLFLLSLNRSAKTSLNFFALFLIFLSSQIIYSQTATPTPPTPTDVTTLEFDKPIEREISGKPRHTYKISLAVNQYIKIVLDQRGVDVGARLYGTDNKQLADYDGELRLNKPEIIEFVPQTEGVYRFDIINKFPLAPAGRYEIRLMETHPATEKEIVEQQARSFSAESLRLFNAGKYAESKQAVEKALEIEKRELGLENLTTVLDFSRLMRVNAAQGEYEEAIKVGEQILAIRKTHAEPNSFVFGSALNQIANSYGWLEDYPKSIEYYRQALEILRREIGETSPAVAAVLMNLGEDYKLLGDDSTALEMYQKALDIQEKSARPDEYNTAVVLNNIGVIYTEQQDFQKAETVLLRAVAIVEKYYQPDNPRTLEALSALAACYAGMRNFDKAEELFRRILAAREKALGATNALVATDVFNLGNLYALKNNLEKAEPLYRRALEIREKNYGADSPLVAGVLTSLALLLAEKGDVDESLKLQQRANAINERSISLNLTVGSERQKLAYLNSLFEQTNQSVFLQTKYAPDDASAANLAATIVLRQKGRVLDAAATNLVELRRRFSPQDSELLDRFNKITKQTAELILNGAEDKPLAEYQSKIKTLTDEREKIEDEISRRAAGFFTKSQPVTLSAIQSLVPPDCALVEFAVYTPSASFAENNAASDKKRYVAYVLRKDGAVKWKDLGDAKAIDASVDALRQALRDPKRKDIRQLARSADEKVMQPIRALAGDEKQFLISPDGELNLIPFEALVDEKGKYLIENYSFTYLTSGRDLLRMQTARASKSGDLLIANPQFGESANKQLIAENKTRKSSSRGGKRRSVTAARRLSETYFAPLGATTQEARSIQTLFPDATILSGAQATETALKQANAPRILHIATHGFFLEDKNSAAAKSPAETRGGAASENKIENPLLLSGLALAGANHRAATTGDDGILTALEASGLNLWGTKLVVLSACDTGLGEVKNGEGVYGLRRAFVLAGAETLVMSLWSISDYATRELMTDYYKNLKNGAGRGAALRQAQLEMLKRKGREHPFYWASFIQSGEWANLDGRR